MCIRDRMKKDGYVWFCERCGLVDSYLEDYVMQGYLVRDSLKEKVLDDVIERFETKSIYCPKCMKEIGMLSPDEAAKKLGKFVKTHPRAKKERKFLKLLVEAKLVKESEALVYLI